MNKQAIKNILHWLKVGENSKKYRIKEDKLRNHFTGLRTGGKHKFLFRSAERDKN